MVPGARIVVLGKQGAGKGTQCVRLSHHFVVPHIATGDMLRAEVRHGTDLGREARRYMDDGELVPDEVITAMVERRLTQDDALRRGFVLDGFPRNVAQAEAVRDMLDPEKLDIVINLLVPTQLVLGRLASRRVCQVCGENYSVQRPPAVDWTCDVCSGDVVQRDDDTPAAIRRRLDLYEHETAPLIAWYRKEGLIRALSGVGPPEVVSDRIIAAIDAIRDPQLGGPFVSWEHGHPPVPRAGASGGEGGAATGLAGHWERLPDNSGRAIVPNDPGESVSEELGARDEDEEGEPSQ